MAFVKVAETTELAPGNGKVVEAEGHELALFNIGGAFYCIENSCPHLDGPLGEGDLDGEIVFCPWHCWGFNVRTGEGHYGGGACVRTFPCKEEDGAVWVEIAS